MDNMGRDVEWKGKGISGIHTEQIYEFSKKRKINTLSKML